MKIQVALICFILFVGIDVFAADSEEFRILNLSLLDAAKKGESQLVLSKLKEGASIRTRDRFGNSALIYAARTAHVDTARILLDAGAQVNQANVAGNTPLFEAAGSGDEDLVRLLLDSDANPNAVNIKNVSPLSNAIFHQHAAVGALLLQYGARADFVDNTGKSGAVYAAANGETRILRQLLDAHRGSEISVDARYTHDLTLLMWAAGYGQTDVVEMLTARGAKLDLVDDRGKSALLMAAEEGHSNVVRFLLNKGSNRVLRDENGRTAHDLALLGGHEETTRVLTESAN